MNFKTFIIFQSHHVIQPQIILWQERKKKFSTCKNFMPISFQIYSYFFYYIPKIIDKLDPSQCV